MSKRALLILAGGILLRLLLLVVLGDRPLTDDAADYHNMAIQLADGAAFEPDWPPGLPYYLRAWHTVMGQAPVVDRVAMLVLYAIFSWLLFGLARLATSERAAELALASFALFPAFVYMSVTPLTQLPTATLLVGAAWAGLALWHDANGARGWGRAALLGLLLAGLVLVRPSNILLCLATPILLVVVTRKVSVLIAPFVVVALLVGAWTVRAHTLSGRWLFVNNANSQNLFYGNNPWTPLYRTWWFGSHKSGEDGVPAEFVAKHAELAANPPGARDKAFSAYAIDHIKARPDLFVVRSLARVRTFFAFDTFTGSRLAAKTESRSQKLLGLAVIAVDAAFYVSMLVLAFAWFFKVPPPDRRAMWLLGAAIFLYAAPYFASFSHPTYHFPVVPLLGIAAAAWWVDRSAPLLGTGRRRTLLLVTAIACLVIQVEWALNMVSRF